MNVCYLLQPSIWGESDKEREQRTIYGRFMKGRGNKWGETDSKERKGEKKVGDGIEERKKERKKDKRERENISRVVKEEKGGETLTDDSDIFSL